MEANTSQENITLGWCKTAYCTPWFHHRPYDVLYGPILMNVFGWQYALVCGREKHATVLIIVLEYSENSGLAGTAGIILKNETGPLLSS